uniref:Holliday junction resolvase n=1 Tax=Dulem virus 36 TaxID=3145754 RepID=A0AAU8B163_9CAUD
MTKRSTKFYRKNEVEVMERLGFKPTSNSGAGWIQKCDGESDIAICELKSTDKESYRIQQSILRTLEYHASVSHKIPVFALQFLNTDEVWIMLKPEDLNELKLLPDGKENKDFPEITVDKEEEICYDKHVEKSNTTGCQKANIANMLARKGYVLQKQSQQEEYKEKVKKRNREFKQKCRKSSDKKG